MRRIFQRRDQIGLALTADTLFAIRARGVGAGGSAGEVWSRPVVPDDLADVRAALDELRTTLGLREPVASIALLPPLALTRRLRLPGLHDDELTRVLGRNASRYFPIGREPQVGAAWRSRGASHVIATIAPERVVVTLYDALWESGWRVRSVAAAQMVWCASAAAIWPATRARGVLIVSLPGHVELLAIRRGAIVGIRRAPRNGDLAEPLAELGRVLGGTPVVALLSAPEERESMAAALTAAGAEPVPLPEQRWDVTQPVIAAALFAHRAGAGSPLFAPAFVHERRQRQERRAVAVMCASATALLLVAGALALSGAERKLNATLALRRVLAPRVAAAMQARDAVDGLEERLEVLDSLETSAPRWSGAIAIIARNLPSDAHLTALRAAADTFLLEGEGESATGVFRALRTAPGVVSVRATAPIRQDARSDSVTVEHFELGARLGRTGGAALADSAGGEAP